MLRTRLLFSIVIALVTSSPAFSQLLLVATQNGQASILSNGGNLTMNSPAVGQPVSAEVSITYTGTSSATFSGSAQITGPGDISVSGSSDVTLAPTQSTTLTLQFTPLSTQSSQSQLTWFFKETGATSYQLLSLTLIGEVPSITIYYIQSNGNYVSLPNGSTLPFPSIQVGSSSSVTVDLINQGSAPGVINSVTITGSAFKMQGLPPLPQTLSPNADLKITLSFAPLSSGAQTGSLQVSLDSGVTSVSLQGVGLASSIALYTVQNDNYIPLADGGILTFPATVINSSSSITVSLINQGSVSAVINSISLTGATFQVQGLPPFPYMLNPSASLTITLIFQPVSSGSQSGSLQVSLASGVMSVSLQGEGVTSSIILYSIQNNNYVLQANGSTLTFPSTVINSSANITVSLINQGSAPGVVESIGIAGNSFQVQGLPPFPLTLNPSASLTITLIFQPVSSGSQTGSLQVSLDSGVTSVSLQGVGLGSSAASSIALYSIQNNNYVPQANGSTLTFPSTVIDSSSSITLALINTGSSPGVINSISITGSSFQVQGLPPFPDTLNPNSQLTITLVFQPVSSGSESGSIQVSAVSGVTSVSLQGSGIVSFLSYQVLQGGQTSPVLPGQTIPISPTAVGTTKSVQMQFTNQAAAPLTLSVIEVSGNGFALSNPPFLPLTLQPQQTESITLTYAPTQVGFPSGRLLIGSDAFILGAQPSTPAVLPAYQFTGSTGAAQPFQQPEIGLSLSAPYAVNLQGTLTISTATNSYATDPAVQFSSGGTKVAFTIPAGTLQAVFPLGSTQIAFQTGTVAEQIVITASFATAAGQDVTPASPTQLQIDIPLQAPTLLSTSVGSLSTTGFTLAVTGFTTTRSLTALTVQFPAPSGATLATSVFKIDVSASALLWFETSLSQSLGGLFSVQIPFTVSGASAGSSLTQLIAGVSVSASNEIGTSNSIQNLQPSSQPAEHPRPPARPEIFNLGRGESQSK